MARLECYWSTGGATLPGPTVGSNDGLEADDHGRTRVDNAPFQYDRVSGQVRDLGVSRGLFIARHVLPRTLRGRAAVEITARLEIHIEGPRMGGTGKTCQPNETQNQCEAMSTSAHHVFPSQHNWRGEHWCPRAPHPIRADIVPT